MTPIFYNKRPLTLEKQADLLLDRGLQGISREKLVEILSRVGYYRLREVFKQHYESKFKLGQEYLCSRL